MVLLPGFCVRLGWFGYACLPCSAQAVPQAMIGNVGTKW